jgi:HSP20 family molecular chaperone IbpA
LCSDKEHPISEQYEDEKGNLVMRIALAGYPKDNISVTYADNILIVEASKVEDEHKSLSIAKRACKKEFTDSKGLWSYENLKAVYKDGLLTLKVPRKKEKTLVKVVIE